MEDIIYITGHKNPDTDSICSAICYAELKNKLGNTKAKAVRLGSISKETQYALDYYKVSAPELVESMKAQISDLNFGPAEVIYPGDSIKKAWELIKESDSKTLSVINTDGELIGIASQSTITSSYMDIWDNATIQKSRTKLASIIETLSAKPVYIVDDGAELKGKIVVAAMLPDSAESFIEEGDIVICGDRIDAQELIVKRKASVMVVSGNLPVDNAIIEQAKAFNCSIISTPYDTFTASRLIPLSVPVGYIMTKEKLLSFKLDDPIEDVKDVMLNTRFRSYPVLDSENKVVGNISRYHLISPNKKKLILVDHNEKSQSVNGLEDADVIEIVDHHRIADIQTSNPIYFRNQPVGCTATIIASIYAENGIEPGKEVAGLLCSAIISDTLLFKSPTSTKADEAAVKKLAPIAEIDPEKYAKEMFKAGSSLSGKSATEIFNQDFKEFHLGDLKLGVSQISTMDTEGLKPIRQEIIDLMENTAKNENYHLLILMITDILDGGSDMIVIGERKDLAEKAFKVEIPGNSVYIPGILSRKKQVIPPLTAANQEN
ncbi:MAG: putative manganese-dependent inorganic diphosphatase [Clostridiaceae bacterium]